MYKYEQNKENKTKKLSIITQFFQSVLCIFKWVKKQTTVSYIRTKYFFQSEVEKFKIENVRTKHKTYLRNFPTHSYAVGNIVVHNRKERIVIDVDIERFDNKRESWSDFYRNFCITSFPIFPNTKVENPENSVFLIKSMPFNNIN